MFDGDDGIVVGQVPVLDATLLQHREQNRAGREELLSMPLKKCGRRRADADDQIRRSVCL